MLHPLFVLIFLDSIVGIAGRIRLRFHVLLDMSYTHLHPPSARDQVDRAPAKPTETSPAGNWRSRMLAMTVILIRL